MYQFNSSLPTTSSVGSSSVSPSSTDPPASTGTTTATSVQPTQTGPIHVPAVGPYSWIGCYTEATNSRALTGASDINYETMTIQICEAFCSSPVQYTYFGVEYAGECYCGNTLQAGSVITTTSACSMLCDGSNLEYCGAGNRLDVRITLTHSIILLIFFRCINSILLYRPVRSVPAQRVPTQQAMVQLLQPQYNLLKLDRFMFLLRAPIPGSDAIQRPRIPGL